MLATLNRFMNPVVMALLRSPLHRAVDGALILLTVTGRRTGRRLTFPVIYARDGADILIGVTQPAQKQWWRNLREGGEVVVLRAGREEVFDATLLTGSPAELAAPLAAYARRWRGARRMLGDPVVMVRLTPRRT